MKKHGTEQTVMGMLALIAQLGITMLVPIVMCTLGGAWLGRRFGILELSVAGFIIGAVAGMQGAWQLIRRMTRDWPSSPLSQEQLNSNDNDPGGAKDFDEGSEAEE